jgi:hypothetical protein
MAQSRRPSISHTPDRSCDSEAHLEEGESSFLGGTPSTPRAIKRTLRINSGRLKTLSDQLPTGTTISWRPLLPSIERSMPC